MISVGLWVTSLIGRNVTLKQARTIGAVVVVVGVIVAGVLLFIGGRSMYDQGVVQQHEQAREADTQRRAREADMAADAALSNRADAAEAENERLVAAMGEAKAADPEKGKRGVGKVTQSYFDNLPERK